MCQGFSDLSVSFASFCIGQISHQQHYKSKAFGSDKKVGK